jgi:hypothetical protein
VVSRKKRDPFCSSVRPEIVRHRLLLAVAVVSEFRTKHPGGCPQRITGHLKASIFIFILALLAVGSVVAQENSASSPPTSATAEAVSIIDQADQIFERAIDQRIVDRLGLFDRSADGGSGCYSVSLDLENEDSDWSFEVTVTMEF